MTAGVPLAGPEEMKDHVAAGFAAAAQAYDVHGTEFFQPVGQWLVEAAVRRWLSQARGWGSALRATGTA
jgi:hypothetical protein